MLSTLVLVAAALVQHPPAGASQPEPTTARAASISPAAAAELESVASLLTGSFSSEAQSKADPEFRHINLHMARIWPERSTHGVWLYVEQAAAAAPERPYRQRVYWVTPQTYRDSEGKEHIEVRSEVYTLPGDPLSFAQSWKSPEDLAAKFSAITPAELSRKDGCAVLLRRTGKDTYDGGTVASGCPSELAGATYATSLVHADPSGLRTWDRGYKDSGEQVWGAVKGPYEFRRTGK